MKFKFLFLFLFLIYPSLLYSHTNHYNKVKSIKMDVLRNGKKIGYNKYSFTTQNNFFIVKNETNFVAKVIGLNLLSINSSSIETYKNGKLVEYKSKTIQNKKNNK